MKQYITLSNFKKIKEGDEVELINGEIGLIKQIDFKRNEFFIELDPNKSSMSSYSAKFNSGWKEHVFLYKKRDYISPCLKTGVSFSNEKVLFQVPAS